MGKKKKTKKTRVIKTKNKTARRLSIQGTETLKMNPLFITIWTSVSNNPLKTLTD